jgi:predicted DNA binding CopG/RHH family protein
MKKKFPEFKTDAEAEAFVETADLSEYDISDMVPTHFELRRKDKAVSLRLPERMLTQVRQSAKRANMPYQRFIRMAIEQALQKKPPKRAKPAAKRSGG